jgi:hypothetical protein
LRNLGGSLGRGELSDKTFELGWQRLRQDRQIVGVQPMTYRGARRGHMSVSFQDRIVRCHGVFP